MLSQVPVVKNGGRPEVAGLTNETSNFRSKIRHCVRYDKSDLIDSTTSFSKQRDLGVETRPSALCLPFLVDFRC